MTSTPAAGSLAHGLSPVALESEGLNSALGELAQDTEKLFGIRCRCVCPDPVAIYDHSVATHLYRIAQESVNNAVKHGKSKRVEISLAGTAEIITLKVNDDGAGFSDGPISVKGMGLRIMHYRASVIGAKLSVQSRLSGGVAVICELPQSCNQPAE